MARRSEIPLESFDEILNWFNPDRDVAAAMYLELRDDLARLFTWAGCSDPEGLTDDAFDRVAKKVHDVAPNYEGDPKHYFHGVARNLIKEDSKKVKKHVSLDEIDFVVGETVPAEEETAEARDVCLESCLQQLSAENRNLILKYYAKEKQAKIDHRAQLAAELGTSLEALRVRVHRLRGTLEKCIERCLDQKGQQK